MEVAALAIVGLAVLLVFSLGGRDGASQDPPAAIPSAKIYDIYSDVIEHSRGDSAATRDDKEKLRTKLGELEREMRALEDLRAAWENGRAGDRTKVLDTFKFHGETIARQSGEAKDLLTRLEDMLKG
ncbi:MAG: hypothetical protein ACLFU3_09665 [Dichotomicrobium sp.]